MRLENSETLTYADNSFDAVLTNFGIFFLPDPVADAKQNYRTLKPNGTAAVTLWKTFGGSAGAREARQAANGATPDGAVVRPQEVGEGLDGRRIWKRAVQRRQGRLMGQGQSRLRDGLVGEFWRSGCEGLDG